MTLEEAMRRGRAIPVSTWRDWRTGKPMMSREEWEQLGRWRRLRDVLTFCQPLKTQLPEIPSFGPRER
jgi:hypothetical protein